jgi:branched-chain amino acid transport system ATP-binding protein
MMSALKMERLVKRYGALVVTDHVSLDIRAGELHAVIGPNGAGKTTLIDQLSGELKPDEGRIFFEGLDVTEVPVHRRARLGLMRSYQIASLFDEFTALENAALAALGAKRHAWRFWRPMLHDIEAQRAATQALAATGLSMSEDVLAGELSYGERRQLELAMALAAEPGTLLLDEPTAGMSQQESSAMIELLRKLKRRYTIVLVEHDMDAVFSLADRISVLVYGSILFTGTPEEIRQHPEVRAAYLGEEVI